MFGLNPYEVRYDLLGRVAVRVAGGGVLDRHVVAAPDAPWMIEARCGRARGWLLAETAPADPAEAAAWLEAEVARRTAFARERQAQQLAALDGELLERLTHRLRTDVMTLGAIAEGALEGMFEGDTSEVAAELRRTAREAQRRMTLAREVMTALTAETAAPEAIAATLLNELEGAGREAVPLTVGDEDAHTAIGGAGWAACARLLAADKDLTAFALAPDEWGWRLTATRGGAGSGGGAAGGTPGPAEEPVAWSSRVLGEVAAAGHIVVAAGGHVAATSGTLELVVPAAAP